MNPALNQEFHLFCEQGQLQKHATLDKNPYCVYGTLKELIILALFVLLLPLILTVLEVKVNTTYVVPWNISYLLRMLNVM